MMARRLLLVLVAFVLSLSACEVRVDVAVEVEPSGSGRVAVGVGLDADAAAAVPNLAADLRVDDLRRTGWEVTGPAVEDDGRTWIRARASFNEPDQLGPLMDQIAGADGPFSGFDLTHGRSVSRDRWRFAGDVDLSGGLEAFSDDRLRDELGGATFDGPLSGLDERLRRRLADVFPFRVAVRLPGEVSANAPVVVDGTAVWEPRLGEKVTLVAAGTRTRTAALALVGLGVAAAVGAVVVAIVGWRRRGARGNGPAGHEPPMAEDVTPPR